MYSGEEALVIAIDIGTTHSAVSFAHLIPNEIPEVRLVSRWPGQPEASDDTKIPTIVAYQNGKPKAFGAEAREYLDDDEYEIARWFKLYLHEPLWVESDKGNIAVEIPPLPEGVRLSEVYRDFLRYMFDMCQSFFQKNTPNGTNVWNNLQSKSTIVLCTPNGWESSQQVFLQQVVFDAKILTDTSDARLRFVTEGEASVHYALAHTRGASWLRKDTIFAVVDAGGSTVDSTLYQCQSVTPKVVLQEVCASECVQAGGAFVDRAAEAFLQRKFINSVFGGEEYIKEMLIIFETKTKRVFDGTQDSLVIQFGRNRDNDEENGIVKGKFSLTRDEISGIFEWVVNRTLKNVASLIQDHDVKHILLVGGLGDSPFLRKKLEEVYNGEKIEVVVVDEPSKKAASEGAATWHIKRLVSGRRARYTIGTSMIEVYQRDIDWHQERPDQRYMYVGKIYVDFFSTMLPKNKLIVEGDTYFFPRVYIYEAPPDNLGSFSITILAWEGKGNVRWVHDVNGIYTHGIRSICTIEADLSPLLPSIKSRINSKGVKIWEVYCDIRISFENNQLKAHVEWYEEETLRKGLAAIIPSATFDPKQPIPER